VVGLGYIVYGLLLFVWLVALGWALYRLGHEEDTGDGLRGGAVGR
jgi:hypothetical protein